MTWEKAIYGVFALLLNGGMGVAVIKLYVERKTNKARGIVETSTVGSQIDAIELANEATRYSLLEKRLTFIEKAHRAERSSWFETLQDVRQRVNELEAERTRNRQRFHLAIDYIRVLRQVLTEQAITPVPPVPAGLDIDE